MKPATNPWRFTRYPGSRVTRQSSHVLLLYDVRVAGLSSWQNGHWDYRRHHRPGAVRAQESCRWLAATLMSDRLVRR